MGVSLLGFGMIDFFGEAFVVPAALILRTFQGLSSGLIQTTSYAIIAVIYPDEQQKYLGILETSMGFGCVIGPLVGAVLYSLIAFQGTFHLVGSVFLISGVVLIFVVPNTVDMQDESKNLNPIGSTENIVAENSSGPQDRIRYSDVFKNRVFTMASIVGFFGYFGYSYLEPVLAIRLIEFKLSEFWIGAFFSLGAVGYIVGGLTFPLVGKYLSKGKLIVSGMFMAGV
jgi:MFS family permease